METPNDEHWMRRALLLSLKAEAKDEVPVGAVIVRDGVVIGIIHSRIARVVFAASEPKAGAVCSHLQLFDQPQMNHRVEWCGGVLANEASDIVQAFFARRRAEKKRDKLA